MDKNHQFENSRPLKENGSCPDGYHKRAAYKSTSGKYVPPRCVRSTTVYKESSKEFKQKAAQRQTRRLKAYIPSIRSLSRKVCPPGMIERKAFVRKYSTPVRQRGFTVRRSTGKVYRVHPKGKSSFVESRCVKDLGLPGRGGTKKSFGPLRKGELAKYGYSFQSSEAARHEALKKAVGSYGVLGVFRKLDAVAKLMKRTVPEAARVFKADRDWIKQAYGPKMKAF